MAQQQDSEGFSLVSAGDLGWSMEYDFISFQKPFQHRFFVVESKIKPAELPGEAAIHEETQCLNCGFLGHEARQCRDRGIYRLGELKKMNTKVMNPIFLLEEELRYAYSYRDYWRNRQEQGEIEIQRLLNRVPEVKLEGRRVLHFHKNARKFYSHENQLLKSQVGIWNIKVNISRIRKVEYSAAVFENLEDSNDNGNFLHLKNDISRKKTVNEALQTENAHLKEQISKLFAFIKLPNIAKKTALIQENKCLIGEIYTLKKIAEGINMQYKKMTTVNFNQTCNNCGACHQ